MNSARDIGPCLLALEDGSVFFGRGFGAPGTRAGEVVFNTAMTGYQEILTDPSYCGQMVVMTYPEMGNYGVNPEDVESGRPHVLGFIVKELARLHSNHRANMPLEAYFAQHKLLGLSGVDTRAITRKLRIDGAMRGILSTELTDPVAAVQKAREIPSMAGQDLVSAVMPATPSDWTDGLDRAFIALRSAQGQGQNQGSRTSSSVQSNQGPLVVAIDCGMKRNILRHLVDLGCRVRIIPPTMPVQEVLAFAPAGAFVSNGPGDPAAAAHAITLVRSLLGKVPLFGICLGHQILALALGAKTYKLRFGHHGANHPIHNLCTKRVEITSQNHGFAVDPASLEAAGGIPTHINLNDNTLAGFIHKEMPILAVQYHPEASPGPHDAAYLFDCFHRMMQTGRPPTPEDMAAAQGAQQARRTVETG